LRWKANFTNSMSILALLNEDYGLALKSLEIASSICDKFTNEEEDPDLLMCIVNNNYGLLNYLIEDYENAESLLIKSVNRSE
jgi:hypothetical protein